jgi:hypothetical protein
MEKVCSGAFLSWKRGQTPHCYTTVVPQVAPASTPPS